LNARIAFTKGAHTVGDSVRTTSGKKNRGNCLLENRKKRELRGAISPLRSYFAPIRNS
jgi:hypothetical protein